MKLTTDFECGSGRITQTAPGKWRLEAVGDAFGYNRYFCLRIENSGGPQTELNLEIHPDPTISNSNFITHFPSHLWWSNADWIRWTPLGHRWENSIGVEANHLKIHFDVPADSVMYLATNAPLRHSDLQNWIQTVSQKHGDKLRVESVGKSHEGRPIDALRFENACDHRPRLLILAGMHSSEHGGVWASRGIVEFLCSRHAQAVPIKNGFDISVVPMLNPDGNVHGFSGGTTQRLPHNNSLDFQGAATGTPPQYTENRAIWSYIQNHFMPDVILEFHSYMGWRRNADDPYDGVYRLPDTEQLFRTQARRDAYSAIIDRMLFDTAGFSAHYPITGEMTNQLLEWQTAEAFGSLGVIYEVNCGSVGISEQFRRGPQVLRALASALLEDTDPKKSFERIP